MLIKQIKKELHLPDNFIINIDLNIKQITIVYKNENNILITNTYTEKELKENNIDFSELIKQKNIINPEYFIFTNEKEKYKTIYVEKRKNNWFIQELYKAEKEGLNNYFNLYGITVFNTNYILAPIDVIDFVGDSNILYGLYNYFKNKNIYNTDDNINEFDLNFIKTKYKSIIQDYQDILNFYKNIYLSSPYSHFDIQFYKPNYKFVLNIKELADIVISNDFKNIANLNNEFITVNYNIYDLINNMNDITVNFLKELTIIHTDKIFFVNNWFRVRVFKYAKNVNKLSLVYDNKTNLLSLIEEKLASKFKIDNILFNQFKKLSETFNNE